MNIEQKLMELALKFWPKDQLKTVKFRNGAICIRAGLDYFGNTITCAGENKPYTISSTIATTIICEPDTFVAGVNITLLTQ